jgi:hypothetical protein
MGREGNAAGSPVQAPSPIALASYRELLKDWLPRIA